MSDMRGVPVGSGHLPHPYRTVRYRPLTELEKLASQRHRLLWALASIREIHNRGDYPQTHDDIGAVLDGLGDLLGD
jgi:hypothetical protein